jgi:hypothetical protein
MVDKRKSDSSKKNNLKALMLFSHELALNVSFYDIQMKEKIFEFLNKSIRPKKKVGRSWSVSRITLWEEVEPSEENTYFLATLLNAAGAVTLAFMWVIQ